MKDLVSEGFANVVKPYIDTKIAAVNQTLTNKLNDEVETRATLGAKNRFSGEFTSNTVNGVVFTVNPDKSVSASGTVGSTYSYSQLSSTKFILKKGSYILSKNPVPGSSGNRTAITLYNYTSSTAVQVLSEEEVTFTISEDSECELRLVCYATGQQYNTVFYPMIRLASDNDGTYAPYAMTNRELTDAVTPIIKTLTAGTNFTLNSYEYVVIGKMAYISVLGVTSGSVAADEIIITGDIPHNLINTFVRDTMGHVLEVGRNSVIAKEIIASGTNVRFSATFYIE